MHRDGNPRRSTIFFYGSNLAKNVLSLRIIKKMESFDTHLKPTKTV
jgi:hypothetical protein